MKNHQQGFSLIELIIAVAIVGILAAIVMPSYQEKVRETRRTEAIALTTKIMQAQERFFVNNFRYTDDLTDLGFGAAADIPTENGSYLLSAEACGDGGIAVCVNIVSTAQGSQVNADDDNNGHIEYNSRGETVGHWHQ